MIWAATQRRQARDILADTVGDFQDAFDSATYSDTASIYAAQFDSVLDFALRLGIITPHERGQFRDSFLIHAGIVA